MNENMLRLVKSNLVNVVFKASVLFTIIKSFESLSGKTDTVGAVISN